MLTLVRKQPREIHTTHLKTDIWAIDDAKSVKYGTMYTYTHTHVRVGVIYYFANPSKVSVCLCVCTCTSVFPDAFKAHYSRNIKRNTHTHIIDENPAKMPAGRVDNWLLFKESPFLYRGETYSHADSCQEYSEKQTNKKQRYMYKYTHIYIKTQIYTHTYLFLSACVCEERERISVMLVTTTAQGCATDLFMCTCLRDDSCRACSYK
jgi:hypothetical protein